MQRRFFFKKKGALEVLETSQEKTRAAVHFAKFELPMDVFLVIFQNFQELLDGCFTF